MRTRILPALLLAVLALLPASARAGEAAEPDIFVQATLQPTTKLVAALDGFLAASTADTRFAVPQGVVPMLVDMYLAPIPFTALRQDGNIRVLYAKGEEYPETMGVVVSVETFDGLLDALRKKKWEVKDAEKGVFPSDARAVVMTPPDANQQVFLVDLGGGNIGCGMAAEGMVRLFFGADGKPSLPPAYAGDATIAVNVALANMLKKITTENLMAGIDQAEADMTVELVVAEKEIKVDTQPIKGFFTLLRKYAPAWLAEAAACRGILYEIRIDGERLQISATTDAPADSAIGRFAAMVGAAPNVENALAKNVGTGALSVSVMAGAEIYSPELRQSMPATISEAFGMVFPALAKDVEKMVASSLALNTGSVAAVYDVSGRQFTAGWMKSSDAKALLALTTGAVDLFAAMCKTLVPEADKSARLETSPVKNEQDESTSFRLVLEPDSPLGKIFTQMPGMDAALLEQIQQPFLYAGVKGDVFVTASGQGVQEEEYFDAALAGLNGADTPLIETPAAVAALERLRHRQIFTTLVDVDLLFPVIGRAVLSAMNSGEPIGEIEEAALRTTISDLDYTDQILAVAVGGVDSQLQGELCISTKGINTLALGMSALLSHLENPPESEPDTGDAEIGENAAAGDAANDAAAADGSMADDKAVTEPQPNSGK